MPRKPTSGKRRTTLTLPAESLLQAQRIAHSRHVNLSTVISEVVSAGLGLENARQRRNQILEDYRKAFTGFSQDELAVLDGVILEAPRSRGR
jgi:hypothetical protein